MKYFLILAMDERIYQFEESLFEFPVWRLNFRFGQGDDDIGFSDLNPMSLSLT